MEKNRRQKSYPKNLFGFEAVVKRRNDRRLEQKRHADSLLQAKRERIQLDKTVVIENDVIALAAKLDTYAQQILALGGGVPKASGTSVPSSYITLLPHLQGEIVPLLSKFFEELTTAAACSDAMSVYDINLFPIFTALCTCLKSIFFLAPMDGLPLIFRFFTQKFIPTAMKWICWLNAQEREYYCDNLKQFLTFITCYYEMWENYASLLGLRTSVLLDCKNEFRPQDVVFFDLKFRSNMHLVYLQFDAIAVYLLNCPIEIGNSFIEDTLVTFTQICESVVTVDNDMLTMLKNVVHCDKVYRQEDLKATVVLVCYSLTRLISGTLDDGYEDRTTLLLDIIYTLWRNIHTGLDITMQEQTMLEEMIEMLLLILQEVPRRYHNLAILTEVTELFHNCLRVYSEVATTLQNKTKLFLFQTVLNSGNDGLLHYDPEVFWGIMGNYLKAMDIASFGTSENVLFYRVVVQILAPPSKNERFLLEYCEWLRQWIPDIITSMDFSFQRMNCATDALLTYYNTVCQIFRHVMVANYPSMGKTSGNLDMMVPRKQLSAEDETILNILYRNEDHAVTPITQ